MSLRPLVYGVQPFGTFDLLDSDSASLKGGEVMTFANITIASDSGAGDVDDGYVNPGTTRGGVKKVTTGSATQAHMLSDDGTTGYGMLFGSVVGGNAGAQISGGAVLGPASHIASGKCTVWSSPGLYAVSLDAVSSNLQPTVGGAVLVPGTPVAYNTSAQLTRDGAGDDATVNVGHFVEFTTNGSLVTTPNHLAGTFTAPDGLLAAAQKNLTYVVVYFKP